MPHPIELKAKGRCKCALLGNPDTTHLKSALRSAFFQSVYVGPNAAQRPREPRRMPVSMRLQDLVRHVNRGCVEAEQDRKLSAGAIGRRRAEICDPAIIKLVNFKSFELRRKL